ncbi:hypothetical protein [Azospirillum palustre]|uniref:hypothetical protein n=1 Tax=Azospirillum palustre TaxID=2044885 RepID=UPI000BF7071B|nr:hypothetical protein [Azospirillum palustre]
MATFTVTLPPAPVAPSALILPWLDTRPADILTLPPVAPLAEIVPVLIAAWEVSVATLIRPPSPSAFTAEMLPLFCTCPSPAVSHT